MIQKLLNLSYLKTILILINFFQTILISRVLGVEGRGETVLIFSIVAFLGSISSLGKPTSAPFYIKKKYISELATKLTFLFFHFLYCIIIFSFITLFKVINVSFNFLNFIDYKTIILIFLWGLNYFNLSIDLALKKFKIFIISNLVKALIFISLIAYFIYKNNLDINNYILSFLLSELFQFILYISINNYIHKIKIPYKSYALVLKSGVNHYPNNLLANLNTHGLNFYISFFLGEFVLGIFSIGNIFYRLGLSFLSFISATIYGFLLGEKNKIELIEKSLKFTNIFTYFFFICMIIFGKVFIIKFFGNNFSNSYHIAIILIPALIFQYQTSILQNYSVSIGNFKNNVKINFIAFIFFCCINIAIIPIINIELILFALIFSKILGLILTLKFCYEKIDLSIIKKIFSIDLKLLKYLRNDKY